MSKPCHEMGEIFAVRRVGAYTEFTVIAPGIATGFRPGHFVAVAVGGPDTGMILRRSFALYGANTTEGYAGTVQFVVAAQGPGTRWLVQRTVGEKLDLVGPLGNPFSLPAVSDSGPVPAVLVGGGYGAAPLLPLADALQKQGSHVEIILGAASADRLFGELAAKRLVGQVTVTTDDGSAGQQGWVTDALAATIERVGATAPDGARAGGARPIVYACGPMGMLRAVGDIARAHGIRAQVSVEEAMACGIGVCMTCVLPVVGDDGKSRFLRSCVDGPTFDAERVRWADVGALPADLVGADAMGH
ncbi:MAG TPA: dihydroorotate dehydrogenase electron transfer subunit [Jatrophihabitans sp.]|jgi:dihydroorotate dehydrogenase electron transfer subunit